MTAAADRLRQHAKDALPAPWFVIGPPWNEGAPYIFARYADPHIGEFVCDLLPHGGEEEPALTEENARLIALAPELALLCADMADALAPFNLDPHFAHPQDHTCIVCQASELLARLDRLGAPTSRQEHG